jgi:glucose/arabinose dehydrogenase
MNSPNGVALQDGNLYVAEINRIWKFSGIEQHLDQPVKEVFYDQYPDKSHHGWKYIAFGPDGHLYVPVGAPCHICESEDEIATRVIFRILNWAEEKVVAILCRLSGTWDLMWLHWD